MRVGDDEFELTADQSCYIAAKQLHSLANQQTTPLIVIEVQTERYLMKLTSSDLMIGMEGVGWFERSETQHK